MDGSKDLRSDGGPGVEYGTSHVKKCGHRTGRVNRHCGNFRPGTEVRVALESWSRDVCEDQLFGDSLARTFWERLEVSKGTDIR